MMWLEALARIETMKTAKYVIMRLPNEIIKYRIEQTLDAHKLLQALGRVQRLEEW